MQSPIYTDTTGLKVLWDEGKKCYYFENTDGSPLPFTITMQAGDPDLNGRSGPTIEALLAIAKHRTDSYNQGVWKCTENDVAIFAIDNAIHQLERRAARMMLPS
jgi:hypothetical protein